MSFSLPRYSPLWARLLGLQLDWQSRPSNPERTYVHSGDRHTELVVGHRGWRWACQIQRYEDYTTLYLGCPWLALHRRIAPGKVPPAGEICEAWGAYVYGEKIGGADLVFEWGSKSSRITLNPFRWSGYETWTLRADGEWDTTNRWETDEIEWYTEDHPYCVASDPHYYPGHHEGAQFSCEVWHAQATCYVTRTQRTRRWLPFWKWISHHVYFDLDDEVGRGKGSWKGGTVGFSQELLPGDDVATVVARAAREGRGR